MKVIHRWAIASDADKSKPETIPFPRFGYLCIVDFIQDIFETWNRSSWNYLQLFIYLFRNFFISNLIQLMYISGYPFFVTQSPTSEFYNIFSNCK